MQIFLNFRDFIQPVILIRALNCAKQQGKYALPHSGVEIKGKQAASQQNFQKDTLLRLCQKERYHYNIFKQGKVYQTSTADLKEEYNVLFDRFKAQLKGYKDRLKNDKDGVAAFACAKWFEKIRGEREEIEGRFSA